MLYRGEVGRKRVPGIAWTADEAIARRFADSYWQREQEARAVSGGDDARHWPVRLLQVEAPVSAIICQTVEEDYVSSLAGDESGIDYCREREYVIDPRGLKITVLHRYGG